MTFPVPLPSGMVSCPIIIIRESGVVPIHCEVIFKRNALHFNELYNL